MRSVALVNQKGGVGKTTTAVNLAAGLAERSRLVVLLDFDPQANATYAVGQNPFAVGKSIHQVLIGDVPLADIILDTPLPGLKIAPANLDLSAAELALGSRVGRERLLRDAIEDLVLHSPEVDFVIIDCPPSLGLLTQNALVAAQDLLIPIDARPFSLAGMNQLINLVDAIGKAFRHPVQLLGVLINLFDHTNLTEQICEQIRHRFGDKVFSTVIARNIAISDAQLNQVPVMVHAPKSSGAYNFRALAEEVLKRYGDVQVERQWRGGR